MKKKILALTSLLLINLSAVADTLANDPFGETGDVADAGFALQVGILVEFIQLDARVVSKLQRKYAAAADATEFRDDVQALVDAGKSEARVLESSYLATTPGQRAKVESIHEFIYPTEYDPPGPPQSFENSGLVKFPSASGISAPCAFDVRNLGFTFEAGPNVDADDKTISLNIAPEIVEFVKYVHYGQGAATAIQPLFHVLKCQTNLVLRDGSYVLASVQMPRDEKAKDKAMRGDESQRVLVFVRADVIRIPTGSDKDEE